MLGQTEEPPSREKVIEFLQKVRAEFLAEVAKGKDGVEVSKTIGKQVFKGGMTTLQTAAMTLKTSGIAAATASASGTTSTLAAGGCAAAPGPIGLIVSGVIYSA